MDCYDQGFRDIDFDWVVYEHESDYEPGSDEGDDESVDEDDYEEECLAIRRDIHAASVVDGLCELVFGGRGVVSFGRLLFPVGVSSGDVMTVFVRNDFRVRMLLLEGLRYLFVNRETGALPVIPLLPWVVRDRISSFLVDRSVICDLVGCYHYVIFYGKLCPCVRAGIGRWPWYYARSEPVCSGEAHWSSVKRRKRGCGGSSFESVEICAGVCVVKGTSLFRRYRALQRSVPVLPLITSPPRLLHLMKS
jgi:hypothetical protein